MDVEVANGSHCGSGDAGDVVGVERYARSAEEGGGGGDHSLELNSSCFEL